LLEPGLTHVALAGDVFLALAVFFHLLNLLGLLQG